MGLLVGAQQAGDLMQGTKKGITFTIMSFFLLNPGFCYRLENRPSPGSIPESTVLRPTDWFAVQCIRGDR